MAKATTTTSEPTLHEQLAAKRSELVETKRSHAAGELVNPRALGRIRKEIARIHTKINQPVTSASDVTTEEKE